MIESRNKNHIEILFGEIRKKVKPGAIWHFDIQENKIGLLFINYTYTIRFAQFIFQICINSMKACPSESRATSLL